MEDLKHAIKLLRESTQDVMVAGESLKRTTNIPEICAFYKNVYEQLELLEELVGVIKSIKEEYSKKVIPNLFEAMQVDSIKTSGRSFIRMPEFRASIPQDKMEKGLEWLRNEGYGMIIKEGVNAQTLASAMREWIKEKGKLPPEDVMSIHTDHYISMRKK